ncbi:MAG: hypothetical protein AAGA93_16450 [Actinomycetota bacterium]
MSAAGERAPVRRAIVHIGSDKTGSTALQAAMADRRPELVELGIWYPDLDGRPDHLALADRRPPPVPVPATPVDTMVLSSEALLPLPDRRVVRLLDGLAALPAITEILVLAYVRAPVDFAEAAFLQRCRLARSERELRRLVAVRSVPAPVNPIAGRVVARLTRLERWADEVDRLGARSTGVTARIEVRPYVPFDWPDGDVVGDAVTVRGLEPAADLLLARRHRRRHPTPDLSTIHAAVLLGEMVGPEARDRILESTPTSGLTGGRRPVLPGALRRRIVTRTEPILVRLMRRHAGLAALATAPADRHGERNDVEPLDRSAALALLDGHRRAGEPG